jgi:cholesterol oxidase
MGASAQPQVDPLYDYKVVVIGSGFGGSVLTCRTAMRWQGAEGVLLLERGKSYPMGSFPRSPRAMASNFWNLPTEDRRRPSRIRKKGEVRGLFDIRNGNHINAVLAAGLGGGSLIYANVFLEPPRQVFEEGWPQGWDKERLSRHYEVVKTVLGARPIPQNGDPRRRIVRAELFEEVAKRYNRPHHFLDISVFFGNDPKSPTAIGQQEENPHGAPQTSCTYCGECDVGCNTHSKNTLDLNYLFAAKNRHGATILTEHLATKIVPVDAKGRRDATARGEHGYRVYFRDLEKNERHSVLARRVVLSAGTLGSTELLLRCRDVHKTLPYVPATLGRRFSANGDFVSFVVAGKKAADPNYGPVITGATDFNLFNNFDRSRAFILQDAAFPAFASWYVMGALPAMSTLEGLWKGVQHVMARVRRGASLGRVGFFFADVLKDDAAYRSSVLLCMGLDKGTGSMRLNDSGYVEIDWPYWENRKLYRAILDAAKEFGRYVGAGRVLPLPTWWWPARHNITVHALGGCILADSPTVGVTNAKKGQLGEVFGYKGLYVADGSIVPTALGANPSATIAALAEMIAEDITGTKPSADITGTAPSAAL